MFNCWKRKRECHCDCGQNSADEARSLAQERAGKRVKVCGIAGGRSLCGRMAALGIYPGVEMELVCCGRGCPCLVRIGGGTVSLGAGVSEKILVTPAG